MPTASGAVQTLEIVWLAICILGSIATLGAMWQMVKTVQTAVKEQKEENAIRFEKIDQRIQRAEEKVDDHMNDHARHPDAAEINRRLNALDSRSWGRT